MIFRVIPWPTPRAPTLLKNLRELCVLRVKPPRAPAETMIGHYCKSRTTRFSKRIAASTACSRALNTASRIDNNDRCAVNSSM